MDNIKKIIQSFVPRNNLNKNVWDNNKLRPNVRKVLLKVAKQFIHDWDVKKNIKIHDIRLTGSLAAFNWSQYSDLDLHIVVNYSDLNKDVDLVSKFFTFAKSNWNNKHKIKIGDHEIEVYVEDAKEDHQTTGLYSVLNDKWIKEPSKSDEKFDENDILSKTKYFFDLYDDVLLKKYKEKKYSEVIDIIKQTKDKIRKMRTSGLSSGGEFSTENLTFKVLRRTNFLEKMNKMLIASMDKQLSEKRKEKDYVYNS